MHEEIPKITKKKTRVGKLAGDVNASGQFAKYEVDQPEGIANTDSRLGYGFKLSVRYIPIYQIKRIESDSETIEGFGFFNSNFYISASYREIETEKLSGAFMGILTGSNMSLSSINTRSSNRKKGQLTS